MRIPPQMIQEPQSNTLHIENVEDYETIYQRCLLIKGRSSSFEAYGDYLSVIVTDGFGRSQPAQSWPMSQGRFKSLVLLSPGKNNVQLRRHHDSTIQESATLQITYIPLLQTPPLHLAIMIAKDSPLVMDCPEYKAAGISSAHSSLDAAVAKFRTTAYMWQAMTAEDMRVKGLGRRSFRIDEEYSRDTTTRSALNAIGQQDQSQHMRSVAKIHLVRSDKTTAELRNPQVAQQNERADRPDDLHTYFEQALKAYGGVFDSAAHPVVAGMIMDSHYSIEDELLLGHAALGCHRPQGLSLGVFGSHLTYSWPRFFEEIASCLTDTTPPGDLVCDDNGECGTAWEACSIGQGAFLHEVGHAFGASHTTGIMARGYACDWPKNFTAETAYCAKTKSSGIAVVDGQTKNDACWDPKDALSFRCLPHFRLPGDKLYTPAMRDAFPSILPQLEDGEPVGLVIECKAGIAAISFPAADTTDTPTLALDLDDERTRSYFPLDKFDRSQPLGVHVLGQNGKERKLTDAWKLLTTSSLIRIPDSSVVLHKRSARGCDNVDEDDEDEDMLVDDEDTFPWTVMLNEKGPSGQLSRAEMIDLRVGCIFDGAVVTFEDRHTTPCGPRDDGHGNQHYFGGHASEVLVLPKTAEIDRVVVNAKGWGDNVLGGVRIWLNDGTAGGELNASYDESRERLVTLTPSDGEKIVGFFGRSQAGSGYCVEFGIITMEKDMELPSQAYDMLELQNTQGKREQE